MTSECIIDLIADKKENRLLFLKTRISFLFWILVLFFQVIPCWLLKCILKHFMMCLILWYCLLFLLTQRIGKAVEKAMEAAGSFIAMNNTISQSIPHLHIHIVPRNKQDGLKGFFGRVLIIKMKNTCVKCKKKSDTSWINKSILALQDQ